jgi:hypothetical protein
MDIQDGKIKILGTVEILTLATFFGFASVSQWYIWVQIAKKGIASVAITV